MDVESERHKRLPSNTALELTPQSGEQDRRYFEGWILLDSFPDQVVRRSSAPGRRGDCNPSVMSTKSTFCAVAAHALCPSREAVERSVQASGTRCGLSNRGGERNACALQWHEA